MNAKQKRLGRWSDEWPVVSLAWATCIRLDQTGPASGANGRNLYPRLVYRVRVMRSLRHRGARLELLEIPPGASTTIALGPELRCSGPPLFSPNHSWLAIGRLSTAGSAERSGQSGIVKSPHTGRGPSSTWAGSIVAMKKIAQDAVGPLFCF